MALVKKIVDKVGTSKLMALLTGGSGTGKTYSARTLPKDRTIVISTEKGELSIGGTGLEVWEVETWADLMEAFGDAKKEKTKDILFLDTLSEMGEMCKAHIVETLRPEIMKHRKGESLASVYDTAMTMEDWGEYARRLQTMIRAFRDLNMHKVMTCLEVDKEDAGGRVIWVSDIQGATGKKLMSFFDFAFRAVTTKDDRGETVYSWYTQAGANYRAKFRTPVGVTAPTEVAPNWTEVFKSVLNPPKATKKSKTKEENDG